MFQKNLISGFVIATVFFLEGEYQVFAREAQLKITVDGFISEAPSWRNSGDQIIQSIDFKFDLVSSPGQPLVDRNSSRLSAKIVNTQDRVVSVQLTKPKSCKIGSHPIKDLHVAVVHNGQEHFRDSTIEIPERVLQEFQIRFVKSGGYGSYSGQVTCESGSLTYLY